MRLDCVIFRKINVIKRIVKRSQIQLAGRFFCWMEYKLMSFGLFGSRFRRLVLLAIGLTAGSGAWSQTVLENTALLGRSRQQLASALLDAHPVRSPRRLSSGALGTLRMADVLYEGAHFEQTLFFGHQKLEQTDLVLLSSGPGAGLGSDAAATAAIYASLVQSLRSELGPELGSSGTAPGTVTNTASWVSASADVILFCAGKPDHPSLRVVIKQRQLADASEL